MPAGEGKITMTWVMDQKIKPTLRATLIHSFIHSLSPSLPQYLTVLYQERAVRSMENEPFFSYANFNI